MHASTAPPAGPWHRRPLRIWLAVVGLVLMVGGLSLLLIQPPRATAQDLPPTVTYAVTCEPDTINGGNRIRYLATVTNPNTVGTPAITYTAVRTWTDGRPAQSASILNVAPQVSKPNQLLNNVGATVAWTHTLTIKVGDAVVAGPVETANPCVDPPTTTTTTTATATTTTTTTATTTTTTTTPPDDTTTPPEDTFTDTSTTDPLQNPSTTSTPDVVDTAAQSGRGSGLAYTGAAIAVAAGIGAVLFANGFGLVRLTRRAGTDDELDD